MKLRPHHIHLLAAALMIIIGVAVMAAFGWLVSVPLFCGGVVALAHKKASKVGLIDS